MTVAIMQPTYLPWAGYFNLMHRADHFVFLNDVQLAKPSWQVRNRILLQGKVHFITVPTLGSQNQLISEARLAPENWRKKQRRMLEHAYAKHPHGSEVLELILPHITDRSLDRLQELNLRLISALCGALGLAPRVALSSELAVTGQRSQRLLGVLSHLREHHYLSPPGSAQYISEDAVLERAGVQVEYQAFEPYPYPQLGTHEFYERLSVIDVMANLGFEGARAYVRQAPAPGIPAAPGADRHRPETPGLAARA